MNYIYLLLLLNRSNYNKYIKYIKENIYIDILKELFEKHKEIDEFTRDDYIAYASTRIRPDSDESVVLDQLAKADISSVVLEDVIQDIKQKAEALDLAMVAVDVSEGRKSYDDLLTKAAGLATIEVEGNEFEFVTDNLEELYMSVVSKPGLRWRLRTMNEMLGSIRKGDFGFVFARPESGKTTFLASEISYFAEQTSSPILWFNNEEEGKRVQLRIYQAVCGVTLEELFGDRQKYRDIYTQKTTGNIKLIDNAQLHRSDVEYLCKELNPALVLFDQIDKIRGFQNDREDLRLGSIYQWARELAKTYCPVIGVCQADATGEGKRWLTMENVANAKTSKQAEADWILGIGKINTEGYDYVRYLHLSKNKLMGDPDTIPALRHGSRDVVIIPEIARYRDI